MISGMAFRYCDKDSAASRANFSICGQGPFDGRAVVRQIDNLRGKKY